MYTPAVIAMHAEHWHVDRNSSMSLTQQMCGMSSVCRTSVLQSFDKVACSRIGLFLKYLFLISCWALYVDKQKFLVTLAA